MPGIDQSDNAIERQGLAEFVIHEEGLRDGAGICHAGGFDHDVVELVSTLHQIAQNSNQISANGAADAAVVHLENLFFGPDYQIVVDADLAKLVFYDGDSLAMVLRQNAIEKGGFARAEEAREHRYGNCGICDRH